MGQAAEAFPPVDTLRERTIEKIKQGLGAIHKHGDVLEIRIPDAAVTRNYTATMRGYFDDTDKAALAILPHNGRANIYQNINPLPYDMLARANNKLVKVGKRDSATSDANITRRQFVYIDIDAERDPKDVSATDEEVIAALALRDELLAFLTARGWKPVIVGMSGNGGCLYYRIDLPNDQESADLLSSLLNALAARFDNQAVKVDTTVFNASRIAKVLGTIACKGENVPFRPHRESTIDKHNPEAPIVTAEMIQAVIDELKPEGTPQETIAEATYQYHNGTGYTDMEITAALEAQGIGYNRRDKGGRLIWALDKCPTSNEHVDGACITLEDGKAGYRCHHNSCQGKGWQQVKSQLFPNRRARRPGSKSIIGVLRNNCYWPIRYNEMTGDVFINGQRQDDILRAQIVEAVQDRLTVSEQRIMNTVKAEAGRNRFHPIKDYYHGLPEWDLEDRLHIVIQSMHLADAMQDHFFRGWLIGDIDKVMTGQQNFALVLEGEQGIGKSTAARRICPRPDWFNSGHFDPNNKDHRLRMMSTLIWELSEIQGVFKKADREALKSALTATSITERKPYGHHDIVKPVITSFFGTINNTGAGFLNDPSGNRRFVIVRSKVPKGETFDPALLDVDIDQFWAQLWDAYKRGERFEWTPEKEAYRDMVNAKHEAGSTVVDLFNQYFVFEPDRTQYIAHEDTEDGVWSTGKILHYLQRHCGLRGNQELNRALLIEHLHKLGVPDYGQSPTRGVVYGEKTKRGWKGLWMTRELGKLLMQI